MVGVMPCTIDRLFELPDIVAGVPLGSAPGSTLSALEFKA